MAEEIRSKHYQHRVRAPGPNPKDVTIEEQAEVLFGTENGGMKDIGGTVQQACDCGCLEASVGGFCQICLAQGLDGLICARCFHRCSGSGCGIGLCLSHSFQIENPPGELRRFCPVCYEALLLSQKRQRLLNLILFPFRFLIWIFFRRVEKDDERLPTQQVEVHPLLATKARHDFGHEIKRPSPQQRTDEEQRRRSE